jgi:hypothetical protein
MMIKLVLTDSMEISFISSSEILDRNRGNLPFGSTERGDCHIGRRKFIFVCLTFRGFLAYIISPRDSSRVTTEATTASK